MSEEAELRAKIAALSGIKAVASILNMALTSPQDGSISNDKLVVRRLLPPTLRQLDVDRATIRQAVELDGLASTCLIDTRRITNLAPTLTNLCTATAPS